MEFLWQYVVPTVFGILAFIFAVLWAKRRDRKKEDPIGTLHIANDPEDGPYLFLELEKSPEELYSKESVVFYVDNIPYAVMSSNEVRQAAGINARK